MKYVPDIETARRKGWTCQVTWIENGNTCFVRCKTREEADAWLEKLAEFKPVFVDFSKALLQNDK